MINTGNLQKPKTDGEPTGQSTNHNPTKFERIILSHISHGIKYCKN